ncbi:MAG: hypothetical protein WBA63_08065 [Thermomicrobiales bacterium]
MKSRQALQRRFKSLAAGEAVSAVILPVAAFRIAGTSEASRVPLLVSAVALGLFLLTAAAFWLRKLRGADSFVFIRVIAGIMAFTVVLALIGFALTVRRRAWHGHAGGDRRGRPAAHGARGVDQLPVGPDRRRRLAQVALGTPGDTGPCP